MRNFNVITAELEEESANNDVKCIYKEVVVVGNGPSGITLSYLLNGYRPYYNKIPHPDPMLSARLIECTHKSLLHQDLSFLSQGIEGRSKNPISLLIDAMIHPGADMGLEWPSLLTWKKTAEVLDHIVLGKGDPGGTWPVSRSIFQAIAGHVLTISLGRWMALPGMEFKEYHDKRAPAVEVAKYYSEYVKKHDLTPYMASRTTVNMIQPLVSKSRKRARWKVWVTDPKGGTTTYECRHLVLAIGSSDNVGCLGVPGESLPYVAHKLRHFEDSLLDKNDEFYSSPLMTSTSAAIDDDEVPEVYRCSPVVKAKSNGYATVEKSASSTFCPVSNGDSQNRKNKIIRPKELLNGWGEKEPEKGLKTWSKGFDHLCNHERNGRSCEVLNERNGANSLDEDYWREDGVWVDGKDVSNQSKINASVDEFELCKNEEMESEKKVLIVGAGLSAADAIMAAWRKNCSVIHAFRNPLSSTKLPEVMYPEYHELHRLMQGLDTRKDYHPLPGHQVTEFFKDNTVELVDSGGTRKRVKVFAAAILVGSQPDLSILPKTLKNLGIDASKPVDCKLNPIQIDPFSYKCTRAPPGLYALGPLVGDNFVRFLQGGAVAVAGQVLKDNSFHKNLK